MHGRRIGELKKVNFTLQVSPEKINKEKAEEALKLATKKIDSACSKGIIKKNTASRKKSNLAKKLNVM